MRRRLPPPWALTALLSLAYVLWTPATGDFAAQAYRVGLADRGVWLWDDGWFGGHHLPSYSVLFPALGALVGTAAAGGVAATASTWAFTGLVRRLRPGRGAEAGAWWLAVGSAAMLTTGRLTFQLGLALGLTALLLATPRNGRAKAPGAGSVRGDDAGTAGAPATGDDVRTSGAATVAVSADGASSARPAGDGRGRSRARGAGALATAIATPLASPVAALFLSFAGAVWCLERRSVRGLPAALTVLPFAVAVALTLAFPNGGSQPFATWEALFAVGALAATVVALPREERALRIAAALYLVGVALAALLTTPMGSNAPRLGTLLAGPVLLAAAWGRRPAGPAVATDGGPGEVATTGGGPADLPATASELPAGPATTGRRAALVVVAGLLLVWQLYSPVQQTLRAAGDPTTGRDYYAPLRAHLLPLLRAEPSRVEVPPTARRGEARWLAPDVPLARGWIRQLDGERNALFYADGPLDPRAYRAWLDDNAVGWVALPDAPADVRSKAERELLRSGRVPGLRRVWSDAHWTLWRVAGGRALASRVEATSDGPTPAARAPRVRAMTSDRVVLETSGTDLVDLRIRWSPYLRILRGSACLARGPGGWTVVRSARRGTVDVGVRLGAPWRTAAPADCRA